MRFFKNKSNKVFAYGDEQIKMGLAEDKTEIYEAEKDEITYTAPTEDELASQLRHAGVDYNGYKVPLDNEAALLMVQIKNALELGLASTNIKFDNGTVVPIRASEFQDFAIWFVTERNKFFT